jgi:hypothetical protein
MIYAEEDTVGSDCTAGVCDDGRDCIECKVERLSKFALGGEG